MSMRDRRKENGSSTVQIQGAEPSIQIAFMWKRCMGEPYSRTSTFSQNKSPSVKPNFTQAHFYCTKSKLKHNHKTHKCNFHSKPQGKGQTVCELGPSTRWGSPAFWSHLHVRAWGTSCGAVFP